MLSHNRHQNSENSIKTSLQYLFHIADSAIISHKNSNPVNLAILKSYNNMQKEGATDTG